MANEKKVEKKEKKKPEKNLKEKRAEKKAKKESKNRAWPYNILPDLDYPVPERPFINKDEGLFWAGRNTDDLKL